MHTVFHVSGVDAYRTAEAKVRNLLDDETVDIEAVAVVVDRPTVIDAAAMDCRATTDVLVEMGATVKLCSNAARGAEAGESDFGEGVEFVSSGVGELTRLQDAGWAYIRL
ncbi:DsrE family protein [Halolamina litorea]|uniref:DsrE family protein n=1 Tax=Halolamina litorea TaxID=1515593 RepID=A0ABD6BNB1_9EURY|nr:DsrE family protein [Halolamina litorea]